MKKNRKKVDIREEYFVSLSDSLPHVIISLKSLVRHISQRLQMNSHQLEDWENKRVERYVSIFILLHIRPLPSLVHPDTSRLTKRWLDSNVTLVAIGYPDKVNGESYRYSELHNIIPFLGHSHS